MNAREMFEELGYKYTYFNVVVGNDYYPTHHICYTNKIGIIEFTYFKMESGIYQQKYALKPKNKVIELSINGKLHQAIHQQMKELGWIE